MLTEMMNKPEREEGGDNPGPATPAPAPSDPGFHPTVAEIMTVAGGLGAGYGASQVITGVGGAAGLTAATWVPVAAAGGTGIGAAGLAGYGVGQILNGMDWFKGIINKITDQMVIDDHWRPDGILPSQFQFYTPNADGSLPWTNKPLEQVLDDIKHLDFHDVIFSSPYDGSQTADIYADPFDTIEAILTGQPAGGSLPPNLHIVLV